MASATETTPKFEIREMRLGGPTNTSTDIYVGSSGLFMSCNPNGSPVDAKHKYYRISLAPQAEPTPEPQAARVEPQYRILEQGEEIKIGDEWQNPAYFDDWYPTNCEGDCVRNQNIYRRRICGEQTRPSVDIATHERLQYRCAIDDMRQECKELRAERDAALEKLAALTEGLQRKSALLEKEQATSDMLQGVTTAQIEQIKNLQQQPAQAKSGTAPTMEWRDARPEDAGKGLIGRTRDKEHEGWEQNGNKLRKHNPGKKFPWKTGCNWKFCQVYAPVEA
jgi:hypothetical protein